MNNKNGFANVLPILVLVAVAAAGVVWWVSVQKPPQAGADTIVITDSGSTNTTPYTITVYPNGSGVKTFHGRDSLPPAEQFVAGTFNYEALQQAINSVPTLAVENHCMKPASFATTETITYRGQTSGDLSCPFKPGAYNDLWNEVRKVIGIGGVTLQ